MLKVKIRFLVISSVIRYSIVFIKEKYSSENKNPDRFLTDLFNFLEIHCGGIL